MESSFYKFILMPKLSIVPWNTELLSNGSAVDLVPLLFELAHKEMCI